MPVRATAHRTRVMSILLSRSILETPRGIVHRTGYPFVTLQSRRVRTGLLVCRSAEGEDPWVRKQVAASSGWRRVGHPRSPRRRLHRDLVFGTVIGHLAPTAGVAASGETRRQGPARKKRSSDEPKHGLVETGHCTYFDGSPVGGGAWSVFAGGPSSSVKIGFNASAQI